MSDLNISCHCGQVKIKLSGAPLVDLYCFGDPVGMGIHGISAHLLPSGVFQPKMHIMCKDALVPVSDTLPHFAGFPGGVGGAAGLAPQFVPGSVAATGRRW